MKRREFLKYTIIVGAFLPFSKFDILSKDAKKIIFTSDHESQDKFYEIIKTAKKEQWHKLEINEIIINAAKEFIDIPYQGATLEGEGDESCRINFNGLDCVTFFENSLGIARVIKKKKSDFTDLVDEIVFTRYRNGILGDYTSRLHYTSEWIMNNKIKKTIEDVTSKIGGIKLPINVSFMSANPDKYQQLSNNKLFVKTIKKIEQNINKHKFFYIKTEDIPKYQHLIKTGDILALATGIKGLDYSHTGLAYRDENDELRLFHASSAQKKVIIDKGLYDYMSAKKKDIGITVLRPLNPVK